MTIHTLTLPGGFEIETLVLSDFYFGQRSKGHQGPYLWRLEKNGGTIFLRRKRPPDQRLLDFLSALDLAWADYKEWIEPRIKPAFGLWP
jgi:hypothetical protein